MVNGIASGCISTFWKICLFLENVVRMVCLSLLGNLGSRYYNIRCVQNTFKQ